MIQRIPTRSHVIVPVSNVVAVMMSARQEVQETLTGDSLIDWQATTATGWATTVGPIGWGVRRYLASTCILYSICFNAFFFKRQCTWLIGT